MGGRSSSSSSSSQTTNQVDQRIAAQDSAIVVKDANGVNIVRTDYGAIDAAGDIVFKSLDQNLLITQEANDLAEKSLDNNTMLTFEIIEGANSLSSKSLDAISGNANTAFDFVDKQRQDAEVRLISNIVPWLVGGASVIAIATVYGRR